MNLRVSKRWLWWIREWSSRYHRSMLAEEMCKMGNWVGTRKQAMVVEIIIIMKAPSLGGQSRCPGRRSIASDKVSKPFLALSCARCCFNRVSLLRLLARPAKKIRIFPRVFSATSLEISNAGKRYICIKKKKNTSSMMDGSFEREAHRNLWPPFLGFEGLSSALGGFWKKLGWSVWWRFARNVVLFIFADSWWEVGFHFIAALNNAFILGYPALIMAYLGFATGSLCLIGGGVISFYNNCLLGSLHETGGKRHIRYRDLAGHIYGTHLRPSYPMCIESLSSSWHAIIDGKMLKKHH